VARRAHGISPACACASFRIPAAGPGAYSLQTDYADIARLLALLHLPKRRRAGAKRKAPCARVAFDQMRVERMTADVALADVDVQLAREQAPLRL